MAVRKKDKESKIAEAYRSFEIFVGLPIIDLIREYKRRKNKS